MIAGRTPIQTLFLAVLVACGVVIGMALVGRHSAQSDLARSQGAWPDVNIQHVAPNALQAHGFRSTGREPSSWSDISIRLFQDEKGTITAVTCHIDADEVASVINFPGGSRRPSVNRPPGDWPWGGVHDPWAVPVWWHAGSGQCRYFEQVLPQGGARGIFASYDPGSGYLNFWQWQRSDWSLARPSVVDHLVADALATVLERTLRESGHPCDAAGWMETTALPPRALGSAAQGLPGSVTAIDALLYPVRDAHRYLLVVHGLSEDEALRLVAEQPLRALTRGSAPPVDAWSFALHPVAPAGSRGEPQLPPWFSPGPGPRSAHCLVTLGSGAVEAGRWVAYDVQQHTVFIWDWQGPRAQPAAADLCR